MYGEHVVDPGARHPAHRLLRRDGRATRRRRRAACSRAPTCSARSTRIRARGGKIVVDRPAPHRHRRPRRRVDPDRARHRRRVPARRSCHVLFAEGLVDLGDVADLVERRRRGARARAPTSRPSAVAATCRHPGRRRSAASRTRSRPRRRAARLRPHRPVQPGVRHARVVARRRREHPHRQLRPARRADVRQPDRVVAGARCPNPRVRRRRRVRPLDSRACAARPRCSARCRCRAWPRRSRRPGDGPDPGADHDRRQPGDLARPTPAALDAALPELECMISVDNCAQRDDAPRARDPARPLGARAAALRRPDLVVGGAQRRQLLARGLPAADGPARRSGRSCIRLGGAVRRA